MATAKDVVVNVYVDLSEATQALRALAAAFRAQAEQLERHCDDMDRLQVESFLAGEE